MFMRVLVVDDSILFRRIITEALSSIPEVEVVGQAPNGKVALQKIRDLRPDLVTLDVEMPEMDGISLLDSLKGSGDMPSVIVVSALTRQGGRLTIQALQKGAFDFITKPDTSSADMSLESLRAELLPRIKALALRLSVRNILHSNYASVPKSSPLKIQEPESSMVDIGNRMSRLAGTAKPEMVLIGVSTGGPNALASLLPSLPSGLGVPVLVVLHMPPLFTLTMAETLDGLCALKVCEAVHDEEALPNRIYIAPGGKQMRLAQGNEGQKIIQITDDPPENNCRPSVDYLFRSVAHSFQGRALCVILTGMGNDGTLGLRLLKRHGCFVIAQDEASCVVYGMSKTAVDAGVVDEVLPLDAIADRVASAVRYGVL